MICSLILAGKLILNKLFATLPTVAYELDLQYDMHSHKVYIRTINLNRDGEPCIQTWYA